MSSASGSSANASVSSGAVSGLARDHSPSHRVEDSSAGLHVADDANVEDFSKSVYEEDDVQSSSGSDDSSVEDDGVQDLAHGSGDMIGPQLCSEELPLSLNLKNGDFELRDQITWSVLLPLDLNGYECNEFVSYNLQNPMIDLFALRTVEEMDFPVGFDISVSRSIRAQIMALIPVVWRERQSIAMQERRALGVRRRPKLPKSDLSEAKLSEALRGSASASIREEVAQMIVEHTQYPIIAVRRLLSGPETEEEKNALVQGEGDPMDLDEVAEISFKKRKRSNEDDAATSRKKRKRGTAFEAHVLFDERIPIHINLAISGVHIQDRFDWDPSVPLFWTDIFARRLAAEMGLTREFELAIAHDIKRQVLAYLAYNAHQLPPEWNPAQATSSAQGTTQANSSTSTTAQHQPNQGKLDTSRSLSGSGLIPKSSAAIEARNNAPNIPTSSLPILSLHNVIRPPQTCNAYAPSLSLHQPSKVRWDRLQAKKKATNNKPIASSSVTHGSAHLTQHNTSTSIVAPNPQISSPLNAAKSTSPRPNPSR